MRRAQRISATDLQRRLSEIMNRVQFRGEEFLVERNGDVIGRFGPSGPPKARTAGELIAAIRAAPRPAPEFAAHVEDIIREQPLIQEPPDWES